MEKFYISTTLSCFRCIKIFEYLKNEFDYDIFEYVEDRAFPLSDGLAKVEYDPESDTGVVVETYITPNQIVNAIIENEIGDYVKFDPDFNYSIDFARKNYL